MEPEEIIKRAKNPNNIPGIFNYCDRWCERCTFTSRCLNRELSSEREKNLEKLDYNNKEYWEEMGKVFEDTFKLIAYVMEKEGIDLSQIDEEGVNVEMAKDENVHETADKHIISIAAKKYMNMVDAFFEKEKELFIDKENELNQQLALGMNERKIKTEADELKDVFEIIAWYNPQIWVKLMRALCGKIEDDGWEVENGFQRDYDGSAKVALVGMDRSLGAWGKLYDLFPEKRNEIISILLHVDKLRIMVENEFPIAREFKRPGFDEIC